ncbi:hypothetical protein M2351_003712 [Azospirillum canadense]|nr:hypothetical protein [Azospirillum canadense]MCW2239082.1 hypothetical protein [Azospirillum canadense]
MKVYEYELPLAVETAAVRFMREAGEFRAEGLRAELERLGVPRTLSKWRPASAPLATNLLQRHRLAGDLRQVRRRVWCWSRCPGARV